MLYLVARILATAILQLFTKTAAATMTPVMYVGVGMKYRQGVMWLLMVVLISLFCLVTRPNCLLLACRQSTGSFNIPVLCTATEALHASVALTVAVQLRPNKDPVRVILGPVETTTPLILSVHV